MEANEFTMFMDVKLDIHDKRPDSLKFKQWKRCEVKIEAIKCLPCFLRVTIKGCEDVAVGTAAETDAAAQLMEHSLVVSIIIPGVTISLASSRTKQYSYGIFWTQSRRNCFIYFALDTELSCRRHMKWIKKSIKNLELYRQVCLEQRRYSRDPSGGQVHTSEASDAEANTIHCTQAALGPLPKVPDVFDGNSSAWSRRVSHTSEIYEEIEIVEPGEPPRLSRRLSRASVASGIYEEMKPIGNNFNSISEEVIELAVSPPPLPPLPPPRKRINTFEKADLICELPRSNTNPESELAKKKKYKNMLDNIFGGGRTKRAESVSEAQACTPEDLINCVTPPIGCKKQSNVTPVYANDMVAAKRQKKQCIKMAPGAFSMAQMKRNSFSSPDLSKINFFDNFDEENVADSLNTSFSHSGGLNLSSVSLGAPVTDLPAEVEATTATAKAGAELSTEVHIRPLQTIDAECLNISQQIPHNFNFSACNTSSINLMGANGATVPANNTKNQIVIDDLTGYCVMAPILKKTNVHMITAVATTTETTSSGYCTGSSTTSSSCMNSNEEPHSQAHPSHVVVQADSNAPVVAEESGIYENMHAALNSTNTSATDSNANADATKTTGNTTPFADFTGNLYENLLTVKASQELEQQLPVVLSTSTPTESPHTTGTADVSAVPVEEQEDYYQTPRKSIISVDDKIPSYYPNSCDTTKTRRHYQPQLSPSPSSAASANEKTTTSVGLRQLVTLKMRRERKENLYISSPQRIIEQRRMDAGIATVKKPTKEHNKLKISSALKITEHVYTVKHAKLKSNNAVNHNNNNEILQPDVACLNNDIKDRLQTELLQLAMLPQIDFRFDDAKSTYDEVRAEATAQTVTTPTQKQQANGKQTPTHNSQDERVYENLLHKYTQDLWKLSNGDSTITTTTARVQLVAQHHLQDHQASNVREQTPSPGGAGSVGIMTKSKLEMHHSCTGNVEVNGVANGVTGGTGLGSTLGAGSVKKFASLPRFKKIDFSPLRLKINNVLQRNQQQEF